MESIDNSRYRYPSRHFLIKNEFFHRKKKFRPVQWRAPAAACYLWPLLRKLRTLFSLSCSFEVVRASSTSGGLLRDHWNTSEPRWYESTPAGKARLLFFLASYSDAETTWREKKKERGKSALGKATPGISRTRRRTRNVVKSHSAGISMVMRRKSLGRMRKSDHCIVEKTNVRILTHL